MTATITPLAARPAARRPRAWTRRGRRAALAVAAAGVVLSATAAVPAAAAPAAPAPGTRDLATVLLADGDTFDRNWFDYDVVTQAVLAVLAAKPSSPVSVLTKGDVALTAFIPNDLAFRYLVKDLTGSSPRTEQATFDAVASLGIDTVETVLLYHVVPGATIDSRTARRADGVKLTTAQGGAITVDVKLKGLIIKLEDLDPDDADPTVVATNLNRGNVQIAHGISRVLRPVDL
ncbi:MAG: fasciclin domain-containing protein [Kineosporiaceae bacterium]